MAESNNYRESDVDFVARKMENRKRKYLKMSEGVSPEMVHYQMSVFEMYSAIFGFLMEKTDVLPEEPVVKTKLLRPVSKAVREAVYDYLDILRRALGKANMGFDKDFSTFIPEGFLKDLEALQVRIDEIQVKYNLLNPVPDFTRYDFKGAAGHTGRPAVRSAAFRNSIGPLFSDMRNAVRDWTYRTSKR